MNKARYTQPCNRCGYCCTEELCFAAEKVFDSAPCPALDFDEYGTASCRLVLAEKEIGEDLITKMLGIGCGCTCPDEETTADEVHRFYAENQQKVYGEAA